jgi:hypothetical protein
MYRVTKCCESAAWQHGERDTLHGDNLRERDIRRSRPFDGLRYRCCRRVRRCRRRIDIADSRNMLLEKIYLPGQNIRVSRLVVRDCHLQTYIDQDDNEEKAQQILMLDEIYSNALFTAFSLGPSPLPEAQNKKGDLLPYRFDGTRLQGD